MPEHGSRLWLWAEKALLPFFHGACLCAALVGSLWLIGKNGVTPSAILVALGWCVSTALILLAALKLPRRSAILVGVAGVLGLRLLVWFAVGQDIPRGYDPGIYSDLALGLLRGQGLVWNSGDYLWLAVYPPVLPLVLAGTYAAMGEALWSALLLNQLIDALTFAALYRFACLLGATPRIAATAALFYLLLPVYLFASAWPHKESLANLLVITAATILAKAWLGHALRRRDAVAFGLLMGLLALTQPGFLTLPALGALTLFLRLRWRQVMLFAGLSLPAMLLVLLPWWIRNFIVLDAFVPLTTSQGLNLYTRALSEWVPPGWLVLGEAELNARLFREGVAWILANPGIFLPEKAKGIFIAFALEHATIEILQQLRSRQWLDPPAYGPMLQAGLLALWAAGFWASLQRFPNRGFVTACLGLSFVHFALFAIWFEFAQRHRHFLIPLTLVLVALAASDRQRPKAAEHQTPLSRV